jgi:7-cyano-7-deazaguanine synthase
VKKNADKIEAEVLILLSGGIDSTACVNFYNELGRKVCGLFVDYGQPAAKNEAVASESVARHYSIPLLKTAWTGHSIKTEGLINGRNGFLIMAALMERPIGITAIATGMHAGTSYDDCSQVFLEAMQSIVDIYEKGRVHLVSPFIDFSKSEIYSYCIDQKVPIGLTYSCESGLPSPCGRCNSCKDREMLNAAT